MRGSPLPARARTFAIAALVSLVTMLVAVGSASAYDEVSGDWQKHGTIACGRCHRTPTGGLLDCNSGACHFSPDASAGKGPHGLYSSASKRCSACHGIHVNAGDPLLPASTVTATCFSCHDGTGGRGVYGAVKARTGSNPAGVHRIDTASVVPGGNGATGGDSAMAFKGPNVTLNCDDCHSPHDTPSKVVTPYRVTRMRHQYDDDNVFLHPGLLYRAYSTTHMLRRNPAGSTTTATDYGSDWCRSCHAGRISGAPLHNHPVDSLASTTSPFTFSNVALLASDSPTSATVLGTLAGSNRGYLMPAPRTTGASGQNSHKPICQQCHWNSSSVGDLVGDGSIGDALASQLTTADGVVATDNPRFQTFPHETTNDHLLLETDDDLCLNCHPAAALP